MASKPRPIKLNELSEIMGKRCFILFGMKELMVFFYVDRKL